MYGYLASLRFSCIAVRGCLLRQFSSSALLAECRVVYLSLLSFLWAVFPQCTSYLLTGECAQVLGTFFGQKGFVGPVYDSFESRQAEILTLFDRFEDEPPFTIQRLAEILVQAHQEYKTTHALLNGIEKLLSVHTSASDYEEYMSAAVDSCI